MQSGQRFAAAACREGKVEAHDGFGEQQRLVFTGVRHSPTDCIPSAGPCRGEYRRLRRRIAQTNG